MARDYLRIYERLAAGGKPPRRRLNFIERMNYHGGQDPPDIRTLPDETASFYIQATDRSRNAGRAPSNRATPSRLFDTLGDIIQPGATPGGIFHNDTRYLSGVQLLIDGQRPLLLSSAVENDNVVLTVDLANPDIYQGGKVVLPRETLHVRRSKFLWDGTCHERIAVHNFGPSRSNVFCPSVLLADFADLFEVRGLSGRAAAP